MLPHDGDPWHGVRSPDTEPPLLPHVALPAEEYQVFPLHRVRAVRVIAARKKEAVGPPHMPREEPPRLVGGEPNPDPRDMGPKKQRNMRFAEDVDVNDRGERRESAQGRLSDGMKAQKSLREGSVMGHAATGRSARSRADRSTVLSNALAEIVKERKADELLEEQKAKTYQQEKLMGSKAAEVAKSIGINPVMLDRHRQTVHKWISSSFFDSVIGFIISVNAATIGMEAEFSSRIPAGCTESCVCLEAAVICQMMPQWLKVVDYVFFLIYLVEFLLRLYTYGFQVLKSAWIKFDLFLVLSSMVDIALKQISISSEILNQINQIMLVRILRLARLARAVRLMVQFRVLWQLVQGLLHSVSTLLWTFLMVMILVYGFAIVGIETIQVDQTLPLDHPYNLAVTENFDSFVDAMFTLFQCFTLDSVSTVYRPLVTHNPALLGYFMAVILIMAISLMNLVTAVMVNSALDQASEDKDVKRAYEAVQKRRQLEELKVMFLELDSDGSGELTLEELRSAPEEVLEQLREVAGTEDIDGLFQMLDYDGGGSLDTAEFCEGVLRASTSETPIELTRLVKQCSDILKLCRSVHRYVGDAFRPAGPEPARGALERRLDQLDRKVDNLQLDLHQKVDRMHRDVARVLHALSASARLHRSPAT
ncbi:CAC [Symbiodinium natans]|uniref:CAC protein n=1 Tax=Symbiodinium natans TaxID=878477 RepID=A0A812PMQ4_9DINO|nr:CAC [Symbiodinium natans]